MSGGSIHGTLPARLGRNYAESPEYLCRLAESCPSGAAHEPRTSLTRDRSTFTARSTNWPIWLAGGRTEALPCRSEMQGRQSRLSAHLSCSSGSRQRHPETGGGQQVASSRTAEAPFEVDESCDEGPSGSGGDTFRTLQQSGSGGGGGGGGGGGSPGDCIGTCMSVHSICMELASTSATQARRIPPVSEELSPGSISLIGS
jgi:hypothetical protein